jgi:serine/threonine-protein kinase
MALNKGATFAGYRIIRLLGSGGMGEVYLAEHPRLPRRDAVKILSSGICADAEFRERFSREASLAAALFHPHVVGVHDRGEYQGQLWISFDYVDGPDAAAMMRSRYPAGMPPVEALGLLSAVASALDHAHSRGLLHRDVKPANILLTDDAAAQRRIMLADFGIARSLTEVNGLTATNTALGTVDYVAPEQLTDGPIDGRADQYSLAATAFHLLTGTPPYQHSHPAVTISRHLTADPPTLSALRPDLAALDAPMRRAMAKDPAQRFPTCRQFVDALTAAGPAEADAEAATTVTSSAPTLRAASTQPAATRSAGPAPALAGPAAHPAVPVVVGRPPRNPVRFVAAATALGLLAGAVVLGSTDADPPAQRSSDPTITGTVASAPPAAISPAPARTTTVTETATTVTETATATETATPTVKPTPVDSGADVTAEATGARRTPAPARRPNAAVGVRTEPDATLITSAGWNSCTRVFGWSACVQAARDAAGAPWGGAPPLTGDGSWAVPHTASYGDYSAAVGPMGRCYWYGYDALGRVVDSDMFEHSGAPAFATVTATMATFQTFGCTPWFRVAPLK